MFLLPDMVSTAVTGVLFISLILSATCVTTELTEISLETHKCVLKPSEQGLFFQDNRFERSHAYVYFKNECFPIYLMRNPIKCVLKPSEQGLFFPR